MVCVNTSGDGPMKNRALATILVAAALGSACCLPAAAQNAVGGMKKQNSIGGPAKPISTASPVKPSPPKPAPVVSTAKPTSPAAPVAKPGVAAASPSPSKPKGTR